jgi:hypothetical protein
MSQEDDDFGDFVDSSFSTEQWNSTATEMVAAQSNLQEAPSKIETASVDPFDIIAADSSPVPAVETEEEWDTFVSEPVPTTSVTISAGVESEVESAVKPFPQQSPATPPKADAVDPFDIIAADSSPVPAVETEEEWDTFGSAQTTVVMSVTQTQQGVRIESPLDHEAGVVEVEPNTLSPSTDESSSKARDISEEKEVTSTPPEVTPTVIGGHEDNWENVDSTSPSLPVRVESTRNSDIKDLTAEIDIPEVGNVQEDIDPFDELVLKDTKSFPPSDSQNISLIDSPEQSRTDRDSESHLENGASTSTFTIDRTPINAEDDVGSRKAESNNQSIESSIEKIEVVSTIPSEDDGGVEDAKYSTEAEEQATSNLEAEEDIAKPKSDLDPFEHLEKSEFLQEETAEETEASVEGFGTVDSKTAHVVAETSHEAAIIQVEQGDPFSHLEVFSPDNSTAEENFVADNTATSSEGDIVEPPPKEFVFALEPTQDQVALKDNDNFSAETLITEDNTVQHSDEPDEDTWDDFESAVVAPPRSPDNQQSLSGNEASMSLSHDIDGSPIVEEPITSDLGLNQFENDKASNQQESVLRRSPELPQENHDISNGILNASQPEPSVSAPRNVELPLVKGEMDDLHEFVDDDMKVPVEQVDDVDAFGGDGDDEWDAFEAALPVAVGSQPEVDAGKGTAVEEAISEVAVTDMAEEAGDDEWDAFEAAPAAPTVADFAQAETPNKHVNSETEAFGNDDDEWDAFEEAAPVATSAAVVPAAVQEAAEVADEWDAFHGPEDGHRKDSATFSDVQIPAQATQTPTAAFVSVPASTGNAEVDQEVKALQTLLGANVNQVSRVQAAVI